ncbi:hypothetical protein AB2N04_13975 [Nitratireductor sp. GISD-1A_MAKvit]|uniref:hypothetical protein n=1 Tax=Nitratireductor sp. GISD-1A_MAKvit TaxID=3234198 RepID=UPI0034670CD7
MMWNWLEEYHGSVSALASVLTLVIWTLYFQILLSSYRRTLRAKILINRGAGQHLDAHCLIANMSAEPIYIEAVLVDVGLGGGEEGAMQWQRCSLSDLDLDVQDRSDPRPQWFQGAARQQRMD